MYPVSSSDSLPSRNRSPTGSESFLDEMMSTYLFIAFVLAELASANPLPPIFSDLSRGHGVSIPLFKRDLSNSSGFNPFTGSDGVLIMERLDAHLARVHSKYTQQIRNFEATFGQKLALGNYNNVDTAEELTARRLRKRQSISLTDYSETCEFPPLVSRN